MHGRGRVRQPRSRVRQRSERGGRMGLFRRSAKGNDEAARCPRCRERLPDGATACMMCELLWSHSWACYATRRRRSRVPLAVTDERRRLGHGGDCLLAFRRARAGPDLGRHRGRLPGRPLWRAPVGLCLAVPGRSNDKSTRAWRGALGDPRLDRRLARELHLRRAQGQGRRNRQAVRHGAPLADIAVLGR
jgi:hypothetical protein